MHCRKRACVKTGTAASHEPGKAGRVTWGPQDPVTPPSLHLHITYHSVGVHCTKEQRSYFPRGKTYIHTEEAPTPVFFFFPHAELTTVSHAGSDQVVSPGSSLGKRLPQIRAGDPLATCVVLVVAFLL